MNIWPPTIFTRCRRGLRERKPSRAEPEKRTLQRRVRGNQGGADSLTPVFSSDEYF